MNVSPRIDATRLIDFATAVYASAGMPEADARLVADTLVQADLWGHQSHGVLRLGWYLDRLRHGVMHPVTTPEIVVDAGAIAVMDGHDGVGQVLAMRATHEAITRAKAHGIGAVAVRHSNHFGTCMYYTRRVAAAGCVGLLTSNGGPAMAPWGGRKKIIGTNPWSVAAPVGTRAPFVVDMAATGVARGKIYLARNEHRPIPLGWALNQAGEPTTDPQEALDGLILPMAEHKGYAIAAMVDMLSGVLTGSGFLSAVHSPYQTTHKSHCGHLLIAMDIAPFQPLADFTARMEAFVDAIKAVPLAGRVPDRCGECHGPSPPLPCPVPPCLERGPWHGFTPFVLATRSGGPRGALRHAAWCRVSPRGSEPTDRAAHQAQAPPIQRAAPLERPDATAALGPG